MKSLLRNKNQSKNKNKSQGVGDFLLNGQNLLSVTKVIHQCCLFLAGYVGNSFHELSCKRVRQYTSRQLLWYWVTCKKCNILCPHPPAYILWNGYVHNYQVQLCISRKLKKKLWITYVYLNFRHWNSSHGRKPWLPKYLLHCHPQIFIQGRVATCTNFPSKIEKFQ